MHERQLPLGPLQVIEPHLKCVSLEMKVLIQDAKLSTTEFSMSKLIC